MTKLERDTLEKYCSADLWNTQKNILAWLKTVPIAEEVKGTRTDSQHRALFGWFGQIEEICAEKGVTIPMIMRHVIELQVKKAWLHWLWKVLQKALFGTDSTKKLKKSGEIDTMVDHFVALFAKEEVELPPFPSDEAKQREKIGGYIYQSEKDIRNTEAYPEYRGEPNFNV